MTDPLASIRRIAAFSYELSRLTDEQVADLLMDRIWGDLVAASEESEIVSTAMDRLRRASGGLSRGKRLRRWKMSNQAPGSRTIWKFALPSQIGYLVISMPEGSVPLFVAIQDGEPHLWAEVEPDKPLTETHFWLAGTGNPLPRSGQYIGSWQDGRFVGHLYSWSGANV